MDIDECFGAEGAGRWYDLSFNPPERFQIKSAFVAWMDVMGTSRMVERSLRTSVEQVGKLHQAVLLAAGKCKVSRRGGRPASRGHIHSMIDGVYVVGEREWIERVLSVVFASCARVFLLDREEQNKFFIRAAISFGTFVPSERIDVWLQKPKSCNRGVNRNQYVSNIMLGSAFPDAYEAEHSAPPFGIYVGKSARTFGCCKAGNRMDPLFKWWKGTGLESSKIASLVGTAILKHIDWLDNHPIETEFIGKGAKDKLEYYRRCVREYFGLPSSAERFHHEQSSRARP